MAEQRGRPMSPHLSVWRWGPAMTVSILHRVTGGAITVAGLAVLTWWLLALAGGSDSYADFAKLASQWFGLVVLIGLTWAFFQHTFSGLRHLVMDTGENFEIGRNKTSATLTIVASIIATAALWFYILGGAR
jgi:succinate dehydrogenase / fumarate reductase cytochrome b subunit